MSRSIKFGLTAFILAILLVSMVWKPVLDEVYSALQAIPDSPGYDIGDGYEFWGWPGPIVWHTDYDIKRFIEPDGVVYFGLCEGWILGESASGKWFAVDKKNFKEYYPLDSKADALAKANKEPSQVQFYDNPKPFEIIRPWTPRSIKISKIILIMLPLIAGICVFAFMKLLFPQRSKQK